MVANWFWDLSKKEGDRERERGELAPTDIGQIRAWPIVLFWPYAMPHTGCQSVLLFPLLLSTLSTVSISDRLPLPPVGQLLIDGRSQLPPFPYLSEVRQKLRLLVGHIHALRLRRLRLEAVQAAAQAGAVAYCLGASQSTWWWRCGHHGRCATSTDGHAKGAWRYIVILRLPIRFLWERKKTKNKTNKTFSVI